MEKSAQRGRQRVRTQPRTWVVPDPIVACINPFALALFGCCTTSGAESVLIAGGVAGGAPGFGGCGVGGGGAFVVQTEKRRELSIRLLGLRAACTLLLQLLRLNFLHFVGDASAPMQPMQQLGI